MMKKLGLVPIPNFDKYYTTEDGAIYSAKQVRKGTFRRLKYAIDKDGYPRVALYKDKKRYDLTVHIIQAITFIGEIPDGYQVNHIEDDKMNMHYKNFEIVTARKNIHHSINDLGNSILNYELAKEIRSLRNEGVWTLRELAELYNCSKKNIETIVYNVNWRKEYWEDNES